LEPLEAAGPCRTNPHSYSHCGMPPQEPCAVLRHPYLLSSRPSICSVTSCGLTSRGYPLAGLLSCAWRLTVRSLVDGPREPTSGYVKLLLPPRQSRGNSYVGLAGCTTESCPSRSAFRGVFFSDPSELPARSMFPCAMPCDRLNYSHTDRALEQGSASAVSRSAVAPFQATGPSVQEIASLSETRAARSARVSPSLKLPLRRPDRAARGDRRGFSNLH
jgi:hypothetical protein